MQQIPDISKLYQQRYIPRSNHEQSPIHNHIYNSHRFQLLSRSIECKPMIKCVKIIRKEDSSDLEQTNASHISRKKSKENLRKNQISMTKSLHFPQKNNQLMRQIMRISNQDMGQLSVTAGGETNLLNMLNVFYERKHKTRQKQRQQRKESNFEPLNVRSQWYTPTPKTRVVNQLLRNKKKKESVTATKKYQKDLSPWNNPENDFLV